MVEPEGLIKTEYQIAGVEDSGVGEVCIEGVMKLIKNTNLCSPYPESHIHHTHSEWYHELANRYPV